MELVKEGEMGITCGTHLSYEKCIQKFVSEHFNVECNWKAVDIYRRIILKWILKI